MTTTLNQLAKGRLIMVCGLVFFCLVITAVPGEAFTGPDTTPRDKRNAADDAKSGSAASSPGAPTGDSETSSGASSSKTAPSSDAIDRIRALEEAVKSQNDRLDELRRIIESQQQTIRMLAGTGSAVSAPETSSSKTPSPAVSGADLSLRASRTETAAVKEVAAGKASAAAQSQPPSIEDRLKKVEERVTKIGPIRLSGDFRLRMDAILRGASEPPDPPLQHIQNIRMRYRLRLNMDTDISTAVSFHGQLSTGPFNNALTQDQDFTAIIARAPFLISEAWIDFHPNKSVQLQGGRVQEVFADNSRFIFDDDVRFNGFNEKFILPLNHNSEKAGSIELRAGQYWFSNPNVAVITAGSPLAVAGDEVGKIGRSAMLFHQGLLWNQKFSEHWSQQLGADVQFFREPNQIQLASTANGVVFLVQPGLGVVLSGPLTGTGNATTTPGGAIYTAENFHVARLTYRLANAGFRVGEHAYPITFNLQGARNFGAEANERDAMLASIQVGKPSKFGDMAFLYVFSIKGANSIISQLTDDDLGTNTGVNVRAHYFKWELGLAKNITLQSLVFAQRELRNSGQFPNFFVPLGAFAPRQYRFQEQILFSF